jgi:dephospho-CoA kinase
MTESLNDEIYVIDCDRINKELSAKGNPGHDLILSMLADRKAEFLSPSGEINREKFSDFVFKNPDFRRKLTIRMGRKIMWRIISEIYGCVVGRRKLVMIDAPILF